uniref:Putative secreted protein n=1 Tax=Anopheles marajoara TaxID=58244 RepID=A0A2M4CBY7_9DIPT
MVVVMATMLVTRCRAIGVAATGSIASKRANALTPCARARATAGDVRLSMCEKTCSSAATRRRETELKVHSMLLERPTR